MKRSIYFIAAILLLFPSCNRPLKVEEGVSKKLADYRASTISGLKYHLRFEIPEAKDSAICGDVKIVFHNKKSALPQIDFKASQEAIKSVAVNGEPAEWSYENEHIIIGTSTKGNTSDSTLIEIEFIAPDQSLNRRDELLYTLLVPDRARTLFPCFDQPNLKASYSLELELPASWEAVTNTALRTSTPLSGEKEGRKVLTFGESEPLSTYLFSFVAGVFTKESAKRGEREISMYHRENDPKKLAQIPKIFDEVFTSLEWMENYTNISYPFEKYDFIVLPGFQYGGMEHTGATLYNDGRIFLNEGAGINEEMDRFSLITHEVAHLWFGDYVTMVWFDDVWTKEVFANYFAAQMVSEQFPKVDLGMKYISYASASYSEDRIEGVNPIKQRLDNLKDAGLVYGNIIYNKSPMVMEMLVSRIGKEAFREGMQEYLTKYAYGNATWEDLIKILDKKYEGNLSEWSKEWVSKGGMPTIDFQVVTTEKEHYVLSTQKDFKGKKGKWGQSVTIALVRENGKRDTVTIPVEKGEDLFKIKNLDLYEGGKLVGIIPNIDARGYGYFKMLPATEEFCMKMLTNPITSGTLSQVEKASTLINLYESYIRKNLNYEKFGEFLLNYLEQEQDPILFSQAAGYLGTVQFYATSLLKKGVPEFEKRLYTIAFGSATEDGKGRTFSHAENCRRRAFSLLVSGSTGDVEYLHVFFNEPDRFKSFKLTEANLTSLAYELAIRFPEKSNEIVATQRGRISNPDRLKQFDFVSRAVSPDEAALDSLFESLLTPENRRIEPWATSALRLLNHPLRAERSRKYIRPALEEMQEVQKTGDIFFPKSWASALLSGHPESEATEIVNKFFADHPELPEVLKLKVKLSMHPKF